jgi:hypothetical protein
VHVVPRARACWVACAVLHASPRVVFVCRAASARYNKLCSLINSHVNNINS